VSIEKIRFRCPGCNRKLGAAPENVGALARCPRCNARTTVPHPSDPRALPPKQGSPQPSNGVLRRPGLPAATGMSPHAPQAPHRQAPEPVEEDGLSLLGSVAFRLMVFTAVATVVSVLLWVCFWR